MKRYIQSTATSDKELFKQAKAIATRIYKLEEQFDPWVDTYEERPSINKSAKQIVDDIKTGKTVNDFSYAYGVREYLKDQKAYSEEPELVAELESAYQDLLNLMGQYR